MEEEQTTPEKRTRKQNKKDDYVYQSDDKKRPRLIGAHDISGDSTDESQENITSWMNPQIYSDYHSSDYGINFTDTMQNSPEKTGQKKGKTCIGNKKKGGKCGASRLTGSEYCTNHQDQDPKSKGPSSSSKKKKKKRQIIFEFYIC